MKLRKIIIIINIKTKVYIYIYIYIYIHILRAWGADLRPTLKQNGHLAIKRNKNK